MKRLNFPFTAIIGQDRMRKALILNLIDPSIQGVLLTGHQGTGKSTAVRSLSDILPDITVVENCPFSCDPNDEITNLCDSCREKKSNNKIETVIKPISITDLPLGVTEDMVCGSLDLEKVLSEGKKRLHPGLLAKANRGILYIDEINLLQDHIVDILLDAAASGVNIIEREGVSIAHPARFVLIGSMNPEEGELRPQINDRLGLEVTIRAPKDPKIRAEITKRVMEFNNNPLSFIEKHQDKQNILKKKIVEAKKILRNVVIPNLIYEFVSALVSKLEIESQRADITFIRCARANAAFRGSLKVEMVDLDSAIDLVFEHRLRALRDDYEPEEISSKIQEIFGKIKEAFESPTAYTPNREQEGPLKGSDDPQTEFKRQPYDAEKVDGLPENNQSIPENPNLKNWKRVNTEGLKVMDSFYGNKFTVEDLRPVTERFNKRITNIMSIFNREKKATKFSGRGSRTKIISSQKGRYISYKRPLGLTKSIAFDASIKRSLVRQMTGSSHINNYNFDVPFNSASVSTVGSLGSSTFNSETPPFEGIPLPIRMEKTDVMEKVFEIRAPLSVYFILDASGSMSRYIKQMADVISSLHQEGYKKKDKTSIIIFKGKKAHILQRATTNVSKIVAKLPSIKGSSYTPLASALTKVENLIKAEKMKDRDVIPVVIICSDLGANISLKYPDLKSQTQQDFEIIVNELKLINKRFARKKIHTIVLIPKKGQSIRFLGVNPFSIGKITNNFKTCGLAEIFYFDGYNSSETVIKLKKML